METRCEPNDWARHAELGWVSDETSTSTRLSPLARHSYPDRLASTPSVRTRTPGLSPATHRSPLTTPARPNHSAPIRPIADATSNCLMMVLQSDRVRRV
ncbi:hypothetical protein PVAP13_1NG239876 [Panicum virgatum]|uniref:Uncharacterized protein n=1 Tax=Panicum virgatum TaxID=38727 RepID=A0A8T0X9X9_PANVG|nr:hypothetical protein PVAP13_1NG239876 [Panicum virgatum]